ncbi:MAG: HNH endonuclease [Cyanobacteria bacterium P01_B01_bin.77]
MPESRIPAKLRESVAERARRCCEYCRAQERYSPDSFSVEHIIPLSKGGSSELSNLAFACQGCNNRKYISIDAEDQVTRKIVCLYHPRKQHWSNHFAWNEDCSEVLGLTATGRATVNKCKLNCSGLVNLRRILYSLGEHPPDF